jgi:hypothetical protein
MAAYKLILHPNDPSAMPVAGPDTVAALQAIGLTGKSFLLDGQRHFLPGDNFLSLITFLGCSPAIEISPADTDTLEEAARAGRFCHILAGDPLTAPELRVDINGRARCPACQKTWTPFSDGYQGPGTVILPCPHCHVPRAASQLGWHRTAGIARLFVEIWGVYPAEAIPADNLIKQLSSVTDSSWSWFYTTV